MTSCDSCGLENHIADWSAYCPRCRDAFQKRCADSYSGRHTSEDSPAEAMRDEEAHYDQGL